MVMSWIWTTIIGISFLYAAVTGHVSSVAAAIPKGAQTGITLALSIAGSICLWSGIGNVMEKAGLTGILAKLLHPVLRKVFPGTQSNPKLKNDLTANICANFLGLGNAATPMGIRAAKAMVNTKSPHIATDELCRLIVLNTASIQLIPANVAALRASLGCGSPFDILVPVWITSICSAGLGMLAAYLMGKVARHG